PRLWQQNLSKRFRMQRWLRQWWIEQLILMSWPRYQTQANHRQTRCLQLSKSTRQKHRSKVGALLMTP
ncbi:MAG: hypothetical protein CMN51_08760, partial [SAR116 cluster bacterium]|nr:hypothetical protein [SAR116 cluster bacterium]